MRRGSNPQDWPPIAACGVYADFVYWSLKLLICVDAEAVLFQDPTLPTPPHPSGRAAGWDPVVGLAWVGGAWGPTGGIAVPVAEWLYGSKLRSCGWLPV